MKFSEIYEHEKVKQSLKSAIKNDSVGHAYIFEGPKGVGKFSTAMAFASSLLCKNGKDNDSCGECKSCRMCSAGTHPDVRIITNALYGSSNKTDNISIDTIRAMKEEIYQKPSVSERKIYIIPNADTMNISAQNSLLKILEEPPLYCTIILIAQNANAFLETVISRAVKIRFYPLKTESVEKYLENELEDKGKIKLVAKLSGGNIGEAKKIAKEEDVLKLQEEVILYLLDILNSSHKNIFSFAKYLKTNKKNYKALFLEIISFFESLNNVMEFKKEDEDLTENKKKCISEYKKKLSAGASFELLDITVKAFLDIEKNVNYSLVAQMMALDYWEVIHDRSNRSKI